MDTKVLTFIAKLDELEERYGNHALFQAVKDGFMAIYGQPDTNTALCEGIDIDYANQRVMYNRWQKSNKIYK